MKIYFSHSAYTLTFRNSKLFVPQLVVLSIKNLRALDCHKNVIYRLLISGWQSSQTIFSRRKLPIRRDQQQSALFQDVWLWEKGPFLRLHPVYGLPSPRIFTPCQLSSIFVPHNDWLSYSPRTFMVKDFFHFASSTYTLQGWLRSDAFTFNCFQLILCSGSCCCCLTF